MSDNKQKNYLKVRDDRQWITFRSDTSESSTSGDERYLIDGDSRPRWVSGKEFSQSDLRGRVEPWLTALFQSEHLSLLAGSGLTIAVHMIAQGRPAATMSGNIGSGKLRSTIDAAAEKSAVAARRSAGNVEDKIRVANELLRGCEILEAIDDARGGIEPNTDPEVTELAGSDDDITAASIRLAIDVVLSGLAADVLKAERGICVSADGKTEKAFDTLVAFLASFASRTGTRDRLQIFTTNYDRLIEAGAELAGIHLLDRFVGMLTPIFRSSRLDLDMHYNPPGIRGEPRYLEGVARFTKLHGSLDWVQAGREIRRLGLPFGAKGVTPYLDAPGLADARPHELIIYPNAAKDRETAGFPYVELFRDLAAAVCRPNSTLVTYGYGFGDEHINRVIEDMLTVPSTHLVIVSFNDPMSRMREFAKRRPAQVSLLIGPALADLHQLTSQFLPKAAIDRATSRMSELLKSRFGAQGKETFSEPPAAAAEAAEAASNAAVELPQDAAADAAEDTEQ